MKLFYFIKKEFLLIFRDIHALLVLFVMPLIFILIMTYALKNSFLGVVDTKYKIASQEKLLHFNSSFFDLENTDKITKENFLQEGYDFFIIFEQEKKIKIYANPIISPSYVDALKSQILLSLQKSILTKIVGENVLKNEIDFAITTKFIDKHGYENKISSTDHNVPSYLIFSMFFILIPISNAFINEKNFGTFLRLKSMNVSPFLMIVGKFIPYFIINQIQVCLIFLCGVFLLPYIGLESLQLRGDLWLVGVVASFVSLSAISFGLLIANIAKTSEEATTIGGISNIILASIGGIMVPSFVMPDIMQKISAFSPMNWALESFLGVLVKGDGFEVIYINLLKMSLFAFVCFVLSYVLLKQKGDLR